MYAQYIDEVLKEVTNKGYKVAYIGAVDPHNYGLDGHISDHKMKAIVYPNFHNIFLRYDNNNHESEYVYFQFGKCEIINLVDFGRKLYEIQLPYLEVLFSKYYYKHSMFDRNRLQDDLNHALSINMKKLAQSIYKDMKKIYKGCEKYMSTCPDDDINCENVYKILMLYYLFKNFNYTKNYGKSLKMKADRDRILDYQLCKLSKKQACVDCTTFIFKMKQFVYGTEYNDEVKGKCLGYIKFETIDMYYSYLKSLILHRKAISSNQHTNEEKPSEDGEFKLPDNEKESSDDELTHSDDEKESSNNAIAKLLMKMGIIMVAILLITY